MNIEAKDEAQEALQRFAEQIERDAAAMFAKAAEALGQVAAALAENWAQVVKAWTVNPALEFVMAYTWACVAHPEWVATLNRTKKKRTRKKYQDKILRAYQKGK